MKIALSLGALLFLTALVTAQQERPKTVPIRLVPGQSYIYSYSGRLVSGIAQQDSNAAVIELKSDIVLQAENDGTQVALQLTNIRVGKFNGPVPEQLFGQVVIDHQPQQEYQQELRKPIRFRWDNGQIKSFEADRSEPQWSVNIKKSILSLLNVNLVPTNIINPRSFVTKTNTIRNPTNDQLVVYPVYEDGINGICETLYQITSATDIWNTEAVVKGEQVFNVTKTRNYQNCLTQPNIENDNNDIRGAPVVCRQGKPLPQIEGYYPWSNQNDEINNGCPYEQTTQDSPVNLFSYVKYNISTGNQQQQQQQGITVKIDSIFAEGKTVYETRGRQIVALTQQNLTLDNIVPNSEVGNIQEVQNILIHQELSFRLPQTQNQLEIPYYNLFGTINQQELTSLIPSLVDALASQIESFNSEPKRKTSQIIVQLANAIAVLDEQNLEQVFESVAKPGQSNRATSQQQVSRKILLDLIAHAGTTTSALFVKTLFENDLITVSEAREVFATIPQNLFLVNEKVVEEYLNLFLTEKVQQQRNLASSIGIALGKMINEAVVKQSNTPGDIPNEETIQKIRYAQDRLNKNFIVTSNSRIRRAIPWEQHFQHKMINQREISQVINVLAKALAEASTFHQKVTLIETLAHTGYFEALAVLAPYVNNEASLEQLPGYPVENEDQIHQERNFIRQVTIYALSHISYQNPQQVLALLLPVYQNQYEPYEIRIAAFTVILGSDPGKAILERIASELHNENKLQVVSFVVSALNTVANQTEPTHQKLANDARFALGFVPKVDLGLQYSKMMGSSFYDEEKKYGLSLVTEWVASNVSQIPRSGYLAVRQTDSPFQNLLLEVGYNVKGIESLIQRFVQPNGVLSEALQSYGSKTKDRRVLNRRSAESAQQALKSLKEKLDLVVRGEEEPKATLFVKLFEQTNYFAFDRHYLHQLIDTAEDSIKDVISQLTQGQSFHYVKLALPKQLYKVAASDIGLPVVITERHPTLFSVKINDAKLQLNKQGENRLPIGGNLTVQIQPSVYHTTYNFVYALTPAQEAIGTQVEKVTRVSLPVELSAGFFRPKNQINWSILPKVPQEVYHHQTESRTFISKIHIAGSPDQDWLQVSSVIRTKPMAFKYEQQFLTESLGIGAQLQVITENSRFNEPWYQSGTAQQYGLVAALLEVFTNPDINPSVVHLTLETDQHKQVTGYDMSLRYESLIINENDNDDSTTMNKVKSDDNNENDDDDNESDWDRMVHTDSLYDNRQQKIWKQAYQQKLFPRKSEIVKTVHKIVEDWTKENRNKIWKKWMRSQSNDDSSPEKPTALIVRNLQFVASVRSSQKPFVYGGQVQLSQTLDRKTSWLKAEAIGQYQSEQQKSESVRQICWNSVIDFSKIPSEFNYDPIANQDLKAVIKASLAFGNECQSGSKIRIEGILEKGDERVLTKKDIASADSANSVENVQDWFHQQCVVDKSQGQSSSYACQRAIVEDSYFKQMSAQIEYENIPQELQNLTQKVILAAKVALYPNLDENVLNVQNEANQIQFVGHYSTLFADVPLVNVFIQTPQENLIFDKVHVPYFRPISSLFDIGRVYKNLITGYQSVDQCNVMENFVRSFDNVTVELPDSQCQFLVAKDCSATDKFSVFVRQLESETKTKEVTVIVNGIEIKLTPPSSQSTAQVVVDGKVRELQSDSKKVVTLSNGDLAIYLVETTSQSRNPSIVVVENQRDDVIVKYDGKNVQIQVGEQYKGSTCGLCGDNNDEFDQEFVGPDACLYQLVEDWVNSYALAGAHCEQTPVANGRRICPSQESKASKYQIPKYRELSRLIGEWNNERKTRRQQEIERQATFEEMARAHQKSTEQVMAQQAPMTAMSVPPIVYPGLNAQEQKQMQRLRTMAIRQHDRFCFSTQPIVSCIEGVSKPTRLHQQILSFHCLPAHSISAQKLVDQSQYQVLSVFGKKYVDLTSAVMVPVSCVENN